MGATATGSSKLDPYAVRATLRVSLAMYAPPLSERNSKAWVRGALSASPKRFPTASMRLGRMACYTIANPPDAPIVCPVMNKARSDARKATSPEMSSGRESRPTPFEMG